MSGKERAIGRWPTGVLGRRVGFRLDAFISPHFAELSNLTLDPNRRPSLGKPVRERFVLPLKLKHVALQFLDLFTKDAQLDQCIYIL